MDANNLQSLVKDLVMAGAGNVIAKAPKSKAGKIIDDKTVTANNAIYDGLTDAQRDALQAISDMGQALELSVATQRAAIMGAVRVVFPSLATLTWNRYRMATGYLRAQSQYAYREFRKAIIAEYGAAPTAGKSSGSGKRKGYSSKVWWRGMTSTLDTLAERFAKVPKADVDADALRAFADAYTAIERARKVLNKRIAA